MNGASDGQPRSEDDNEPVAAGRRADAEENESAQPGSGVHMSYWRFGAMIATSTAVMFVLMYLNTYAWDHVRWSETRFFMAFVMGAAMAVIMLGFMLSMYKDARINIGIVLASIVVFAVA